MTAPIRVLLADHQAMIRGASAALPGMEPDMCTRDMAVLKVQMPGMNGRVAAGLHAQQLPRCKGHQILDSDPSGSVSSAESGGDPST